MLFYWFNLGLFALQPSEIFKIALIIYVSDYISLHYHQMKKLRWSFSCGLYPHALQMRRAQSRTPGIGVLRFHPPESVYATSGIYDGSARDFYGSASGGLETPCIPGNRRLAKLAGGSRRS